MLGREVIRDGDAIILTCGLEPNHGLTYGIAQADPHLGRVNVLIVVDQGHAVPVGEQQVRDVAVTDAQVLPMDVLISARRRARDKDIP